MLSFKEAIRICFHEKFASCEGRATRAEYWWFELLVILCMFVPCMLMGILAASTRNEDFFGIAGVLISIASLALIVPAFCVRVRRLHDVGHSGWFILISLIPYLGSLILLIYLLKPSDEGVNDYGENPNAISQPDAIITDNEDSSVSSESVLSTSDVEL